MLDVDEFNYDVILIEEGTGAEERVWLSDESPQAAVELAVSAVTEFGYGARRMRCLVYRGGVGLPFEAYETGEPPIYETWHAAILN